MKLKKMTAVFIAAMMMGAGASAYTDMEENEASALLTRLGIISGYEDGSFRPDNTVTRAEAAVMAVKAIGFTDEDAAKYKDNMTSAEFRTDSRAKVTDFDDYDSAYWANAYIQLAMDNSIISGFDDNTFRPEETVTMAQLMTMLVGAVGYDTYAEATGGYPSGYLQWADVAGITEGLGSFNNDKKATRRDVMTAVKNMLEAPVCVIASYETAWDGRVVPMLEIKDGEGADFQSLLTKRYDIYTADTKITDPSARPLKVRLLSSVNFDDEKVEKGDNKTVSVKVDEKSAQYVKEKGEYKMYIHAADNEYELIYADK